MREIAERLHENHQIQLAKEILESNGYTVVKESAEEKLQANIDALLDKVGGIMSVLKIMKDAKKAYPGIEDDADELASMTYDRVADEVSEEEWLGIIEYALGSSSLAESSDKFLAIIDTRGSSSARLANMAISDGAYDLIFVDNTKEMLKCVRDHAADHNILIYTNKDIDESLFSKFHNIEFVYLSGDIN